jgi:hypothetical protein
VAAEEFSERRLVAWVIGSPQGGAGLGVAVLYVLLVIARQIPEASALTGLQELGSKHPMLLESLPDLVQCIGLLPALWWCIRIDPPSWIPDKVARTACIQFARCMAALIASWIVFYLLNAIYTFHPSDLLGPWVDFANNMQGLFLFASYWTLTAITVSDRDTRNTLGLPHIFAYSLWVVGLILAADIVASRNPGSRFWFQLLSGMSVGICMALVIGCLENEYLESMRISTAVLYGYAVLQLAYVGFNAGPTKDILSAGQAQNLIPHEALQKLQLLATVSSLPLKVVFILLCYGHLKSGRLAFYMEKTRGLILSVSDEWARFTLQSKKTEPIA